MSPFVRALLGFWIWGFGLGTAIAQPPDSQRVEQLRIWVTGAINHAPDEVDVAVLQIRTWNSAGLNALRDHIRTVLRLMVAPDSTTFHRDVISIIPERITYSEPELRSLRAIAVDAASRGDGNQLLRRGAMLHTTIAMRAPPLSETGGSSAQTLSAAGSHRIAPDSIAWQGTSARVGPSLEQRTVRVEDGRSVAQTGGADHWEMARWLLDEVTSNPGGARRQQGSDPFIRLWYGALGSYMLSTGKLWWPHFEKGLQLFPDDPKLLFLVGSLHEAYAAPAVQNAVQALASQRVETVVRSAPRELRSAESRLRRVLILDPELVEARIRLGRVLALLDRPGDALRELNVAASGTSDPLLGYYAKLFIGRAAEALGDWSRARNTYEEAATLYPRAQSPRLALSQLAQLTGGETVRPINDVLTLPPADRGQDDPWWTYHTAAGRDADVMLDQLHSMLLAGDRQ